MRQPYNGGSSEKATVIPFCRKSVSMNRQGSRYPSRQVLSREGGDAKRNLRLARARSVIPLTFRPSNSFPISAHYFQNFDIFAFFIFSKSFRMATIQNLIGKFLSKQIVDSNKLNDFRNLFESLYKNIDACVLQGGPLEERQKGYFQTFLKSVLDNKYEVSLNMDRIDLVLHEDNNATSPISVIFEVKSSENKGEMVSDGNLNVKALQELVLYYMQQRESKKQTHIQYLIALDFNEMFIFPAETFETNFHKNKQLY